jgi:hypothetical protein
MCDWLVPMAADPLVSRGMMGDGVIDFGRDRVDSRSGRPQWRFEVEIFNESIWATDYSAVLKVMKQRYRDLVSLAIDRSG